MEELPRLVELGGLGPPPGAPGCGSAVVGCPFVGDLGEPSGGGATEGAQQADKSSEAGQEPSEAGQEAGVLPEEDDRVERKPVVEPPWGAGPGVPDPWAVGGPGLEIFELPPPEGVWFPPWW